MGDRVRDNTPPHINEKINRDIQESVLHYSKQSGDEIARRIGELDKE